VVLEIVIPVAFLFLIILAAAIKIVREYERAVIFRLGRLKGTKGPGLFIMIPVIDKKVVVDLRILSIDVPRQRIITEDNVSVEVDAVVYYRVDDPIRAVVRVRDFFQATNLLAQTTLRDVIGQVPLDHLLSKREDLNRRIQDLLDVATDPWGIKVQVVTIRDVNLPENMVRAIAKQAEAERERRGRVIVAEGEYQAAQKMLDAAQLYVQSEPALRLRELGALLDIAKEGNLVIVTTTGAALAGTGGMVGIASAVQEKAKKGGG
jgi:regulator of protease activity HflC (stomatin/prohibitin superfamily)